MAGRVAAVLLVAGAVGVVAWPSCKNTAYRPYAPIAKGNEVWLYVYKLGPCKWHSGIGTQGGYWFYTKEGVTEYQDYTKDRCNGPLTFWIKLGYTYKTKWEIDAIIANLKHSCYPNYKHCWKFIPSHFRLLRWNCNYFTHHVAAALNVVEGFPSWLWTDIPGFHC